LTNNGSVDVAYAMNAISTRINKEALELSKKHGKNFTGFIVTSGEIIAGLISSGAMTFAESGNMNIQIITDNDNRAGKMSQYLDVVQDKYADENYVLVGWKEKIDGNAGVIFSPYSLTTHEWLEPESGKVVTMIMNRYGYVRNAFDEGDAISSDFFSTFNVDFSGLIGY
jgi:hypothetical protein